MSIARKLKITAVIICNPHHVLISGLLFAISGADWILDKLDDLTRASRNWLEAKADSAPVFAKNLSGSLVRESANQQSKRAVESIMPKYSKVKS